MGRGSLCPSRKSFCHVSMCYTHTMTSTRSAPKLPSLPRALYSHVVKGRVDALEALLQHPSVDYDTPLKDGVYTLFHAVALCKDIPVQRHMLTLLSQKWPAGHPAWSSRKHWAESSMSDLYHFHWYQNHGCPVDEPMEEHRSLLEQVVLGSYQRTTDDSMAAGMELFHHLREELPSCQGDFQLHLAWQSAVLGVHVEMMEMILGLGVVDVNQRMLGDRRNMSKDHFEFVGMDPVDAIFRRYNSFSINKPRYDRAFDALHRQGLDWGISPASRDESRQERMESVLGAKVAGPWYEELHARARALALDKSLPRPTVSRRLPRF